MPGHSTSINLRENHFKSLPKPWGDCTAREQLEYLNAYSYSTQTCLAVCKIKYVLDICGCLLFTTPPPDYIHNQPVDLYLRFDNVNITLRQLAQNIRCANGAKREFDSRKSLQVTCDCREAYKYIIYDLTISENIWPAAKYQIDAYWEIVMENPNNVTLLAY